jgi:polysaccharide biosynthesis/export protein
MRVSIGRCLRAAMTVGPMLLLGLARGGVEAQAPRTAAPKTTPSATATPADPTPGGTSRENAPGPTEGYRVGPGDLLQIVVWKEAELTRDALVRIDGRITVPLVGDVEAAGRTPKQLSEEIGRTLARFVTSPQVTVGVGQAMSARVYVIGQVARSGEISLAVPLTVVQALALSGGFKEFARSDSILVVGRDRSSRSFNYKRFEAGRDLEQNVLLRSGDTIVVP